MSLKLGIILASAALYAGAAAAALPDSSLSISQRVVISSAPDYSFFTLAWQNPAARQWQMPISISEVHVSYRDNSTNLPVSITQGRGERLFDVGASTYMKYKSSTLWGSAYYNNGRQLGLQWNETSDAALLYPYLTADSVGGDMHLERYRFMGGYADHKGSWSWGAEIGYLAGLYYRSVDPRPKNITGLLTLRAGAGYTLSKSYSLSLGLMAERYQQTNEITFMSETYESKIYHATGLGTHYVRFAGTGKNSKYAGWRYGGELELVPTDTCGFIATAEVLAFNLEKILTDLNRLPLVSVHDLDINAEAGYRGIAEPDHWMLSATLFSHSRKGKENIFGDPSLSIYPQIASLSRYSASSTRVRVAALWSHWRNGLPLLSLKPALEFSNLEEKYPSPLRKCHISSLTSSLYAQAFFSIPWQLKGIFSLGGEAYSPLSSSLTTDGQHLNDDHGLTEAWLRDYERTKASAGSIDVSLSFTRPISSRYALQLSGQYRHLFLPLSNAANQWQISLAFLL